MLDSSYTDAGSLKELFDYLLRRNVGLVENVLECLLSSLTTRERSLSVSPPWCLYLDPSAPRSALGPGLLVREISPCPLVLETAAGRCDLDEVRVMVWSRHPPYGDNLAEYLEQRCRNRDFSAALAGLDADTREFNIIVDEPPGYPKTDGTIVEPPLSSRVYRKMDGIVVMAPYGELIPAERFGVRVPTDVERAALRKGSVEPSYAEKVAAIEAHRREHKCSADAAYEALHDELGHNSGGALKTWLSRNKPEGG